MLHLLYINKEQRDTKFKELKAQGKNVYRRVSTGQQIHPQYVEDYPDQSVKADNGFGNTVYKTYFPKLYVIEEINY